MKTLTRLSSALLLLAAPSCSVMSKLTGLSSGQEPSVVFALGTRDGFQSPLLGALKPACPALVFADEGYAITGGHRKTLSALAAEWSVSKPKYLIAGYVAPGLPEDFARSLTERRAQAVRQQVIESGIEASHLQTVGFGFDSSPSSPTSSVVVIYQQ
jgi:hypothetical protein